VTGVQTCALPISLFGNRLLAGVKRDLARDIAAILDLDLGIGDLARDMAASADQQPLADSELALEAAADLGIVDRRTALEEPALGDINIAALMQIGFDIALDGQPLAGRDLA